MSDYKKFIDVRGAFRQKNPGLYKIMPSFIINAIRRLIHEDDINAFIDRNRNCGDFEFADAIIEEYGIDARISGIENIPASGGCVIASNHPMGGREAIALIKAVSSVRKDQKFIVNDLLLQLTNFKNIFSGVNKFGRNRQGVLNTIDDLYASGQVIMIFPAGLVSRKQDNGLIRDLEWKKSFVSKARKYGLKIIPVYVGGTLSGRFYNLGRLRKKMGIGVNLEMLLLPGEMYKQKGKSFPIIFGKALDSSEFSSDINDYQWAEKIRDHVYEIGEASNKGTSYPEFT